MVASQHILKVETEGQYCSEISICQNVGQMATGERMGSGFLKVNIFITLEIYK